MSTLPSGYTKLQYIESTGSQVISTGVGSPDISSCIIEAVMEHTFTSVSTTSCFLGTSNVNHYLAIWARDSGWICAQNLSQVNLATIYPKRKMTLKIDMSTLTFSVDDESCQFTSGIGGGLKSLSIFAIPKMKTSGYEYFCPARLYSMTITKSDGTLLRDYIPCKNSNGVVGLYDTVDGTFYGNAGTGSFIAGEEPKYSITLNVSPTGSGTVTGGGTYTVGKSVTIQAFSNDGYNFAEWQENGTTLTENTSYTFTVSENKTFTAVFEKNPVKYTITVSADPENGGTVTGGGTYDENSVVTITAEPAEGYEFSCWTDGTEVFAESATHIFTPNASLDLIAVFEKKEEPPEPPEPSIGAIASGFGRRELYVDARDLQSDSDPEKPLTPEEYKQLLETRGLEKLIENQLVQTFDAVVRVLDPTYVYGNDFQLGDKITVTDDRLGITADAIVQAVRRSVGEDGVGMELTLGYDAPTIYEILKRKATK